MTARLLNEELIFEESNCYQLSVGRVFSDKLFWTTVVNEQLTLAHSHLNRPGMLEVSKVQVKDFVRDFVVQVEITVLVVKVSFDVYSKK